MGRDGGDAAEFTGKERDAESGLDYFGARYYGSALGRFTSPDPLFFQKEMLEDPQRWNLYAYVRNSPLVLSDPTGEAIALSDDADERKKQLAALQKLAGDTGGHYLYDNAVDGKHYVGIYTNGDSGKGPDFGDTNSVAAGLKDIINNKTVADVSIQRGDAGFTNERGKTTNLDAERADGATVARGGQIHIYIRTDLDKYSNVDFFKMSNFWDADNNMSTVLGHELGHVRFKMTHTGPDPGGKGSNGAAIDFENKVRKLQNPNAAHRWLH